MTDRKTDATRTAAFDDAPYIEVVEDTDLIAWQFKDPDTNRVYTGSTFHLRVVPDDLQKKLRKEATSYYWRRGIRHEDFDFTRFADACLDYAIVRWDGVKRQGVELPCERKYKLALPDVVRAELVKLVIGRELGMVQSSGDDDETDTERDSTAASAGPIPAPGH